MSKFVSFNQRINTAASGQALTDIVEYTISVPSGLLAVYVILRDMITGATLCQRAYDIGDIFLGGNRTETLPDQNTQPTVIVMPANSLRMRAEVWDVGVAGTTVRGDATSEFAVYLPNQVPPGGVVPPDQVLPLAFLGLAAVAGISGVAYLRYKRGRG